MKLQFIYFRFRNLNLTLYIYIYSTYIQVTGYRLYYSTSIQVTRGQFYYALPKRHLWVASKMHPSMPCQRIANPPLLCTDDMNRSVFGGDILYEISFNNRVQTNPELVQRPLLSCICSNCGYINNHSHSVCYINFNWSSVFVFFILLACFIPAKYI